MKTRRIRKQKVDFAKPSLTVVPKPNPEEIARTWDGRDITRGFVDRNALDWTTDQIIRCNHEGLPLYRKVLDDPQVYSALSQRFMARIAGDMDVAAGGSGRKDRMAADSLKDQLQCLNFDKIDHQMGFGVFYGAAMAELLYGIEGKEIRIEDVKVRNRQRFVFTHSGEMRMRTHSSIETGEPLPARKFWHFSTGADNTDEPYGIGLAHWLYWYCHFKRNIIKYWLVHLEKFGSPTVVGKFPNTMGGDDPESTEWRGKLLDAMRAVQTDAAIITPEMASVDLLGSARTGGSSHGELLIWIDQQTSKIILGQTSTLDGGSGQYKAESQERRLEEIIRSDANLILSSFNNGPAQWLTDWNYPGAAYPKVWRNLEPDEDLNDSATRDEKLFAIGFRRTLEDQHRAYGDGYEKVNVIPPTPGHAPQEVAGPVVTDEPADIELAAFAEDLSAEDQLAFNDALESIGAERFGDDAEQVMQPILDKILQEGQEATAADLAALYPEMDSENLEALLAKMAFIASIWGRA